MESWKERISVNPSVCHGKACIQGTRVMVSVILDTSLRFELSGLLYRITQIIRCCFETDICDFARGAAWLIHQTCRPDRALPNRRREFRFETNF